MHLQDLHGTWHIHFTNFPMWLKGDKTHPQFHYAPDSKANTLIDTVTYHQSGRQKTLLGRDTQTGPTSFRWRGHGLLALVKSDWQIAYLSQDKDWAIIAFQRSLFTPAGHDIISRGETLTSDNAKQMLQKFQELYPGTVIHRLDGKTIAD